MKKEYSEEYKQRILRELNDKRLEEEHYETMRKKRVFNKKIYRYDVRKFYKFLNMDREYFIDVNDVKNLSTTPSLMTLYYRNFGELKKREFLIKVVPYSDKIFISADIIKVYFKPSVLENNK